MKIIFLILFGLFSVFNNISIKNKSKPLTKKKNPDDEELGKTTKGDSIGTNLYNSMVVTKALIRPQKWFFNVVLTRPSTKYFREAESNGLHYQIDRLNNELEKDYRRNMEDYYDQKLESYENKLKNAAKIKKNIRPETYSVEGTKYPVYQPIFLETNISENLRQSSLLDADNFLQSKNKLENGPLIVDKELLETLDNLEDFNLSKLINKKEKLPLMRYREKESVSFLPVGPKISSLRNSKGELFEKILNGGERSNNSNKNNPGYYGKSRVY